MPMTFEPARETGLPVRLIKNLALYAQDPLSLDVLVGVEGRRWTIEDAFETAKTELGLDHNETRSWHGWHRHVSLVMLAFALLTVIRHRANTTLPPPKSAPITPGQRWSAGPSRRSAVSPAG